MKLIAYTFAVILLLVSAASAQYTESPIAHLSRAEGTLYVGAGNNRITTLLSSANGRSLVTAENYAAMKTLLAYGTMADQAANSVAITGGTINGTTIGGTTPAAGSFTTLSLGDAAKLLMGNSGATDSYIDYTGSLLEMYAVGGIIVKQPADYKGFRIYGYNTQNSKYGELYIDHAGGTVLNANGSISTVSTSSTTFTSTNYISLSAGITFRFLDNDASGAERIVMDSAATPSTGRIVIPEDSTKSIVLGADNDARIGFNTTNLELYDPVTGTKTLAQLATDTDTLGSIGSVANGDIVIYNSGWKRLGKGDDGQFLKLASGLPSWSGIAASNISDQNAGTDVTADLEEETHASEHAVGGADTVFPADPGADRILMWDDDPGQLVWTTDTDTTYSAGDGLDLTGTTFSTDLKSGGGLEIESGELRLSALEAPATAEDTDDAETVDFSANLIYKLTLNNDTGPCVLSFTDPPAGSRCLLVLIQDADGGETVTWPAAETIYWAGGTAFDPDTTAASRAVVTLVFDGTDYYCTGYDYATP